MYRNYIVTEFGDPSKVLFHGLAKYLINTGFAMVALEDTGTEIGVSVRAGSTVKLILQGTTLSIEHED